MVFPIEHNTRFPGIKRDQSGTFTNNMQKPVHRWFRYSAGFSAEWVENEIQNYQNTYKKKPNILDPFVGSGTVLIEANKAGCNSIGVESHPFISRVTKAKLLWHSDTDDFTDFAKLVFKKATHIKGDVHPYPLLIKKCYSEAALLKLDQLKKAFLLLKKDTPASSLVWLVITSILRICSFAGTAQWQYILPKKRKSLYKDPHTAFLQRVSEFTVDMTYMQNFNLKPQIRFLTGDIREQLNLPKAWGDLLITSPPYANNYDYADAVRLELSFWGEVESWSDLQTVIRPYLIRSCTQHISRLKNTTYDILNTPLLTPIKNEITKVCKKLDITKESRGGKKPYHTMVATYFLDLAKAWKQLRQIMKPHSRVCFVIGDSAPYGVYIPVHKWLGELALYAGFKAYSFEKIRDRNIKWKNRKHTVPLNEGHLWVEG